MRISALGLLILSVSTFVTATATAQTSMQRRAQEQAAQDSTADDSGETAREATTTRPPPSSEPEVIRGDQRGRQGTPGSGEQFFNFFTGHLPGLRLDVGLGEPSIYGIGVGYMYTMGWEMRALGQEVGVVRAGLGPDLAFQVSERGFKGVTGFAKGRFHLVSNAYGLGLEGGLGTGLSSRGFSPALRLGVYFAGKVFEAGYFYQHTFFERPDQMRAHNVGVRIHIPLIQQ